MDTREKIRQKKNPRETANIFSITFFWYSIDSLLMRIKILSFCTTRWMNSLLGEGYKKELELEDLFEPRKTDESDYQGSKLER